MKVLVIYENVLCPNMKNEINKYFQGYDILTENFEKGVFIKRFGIQENIICENKKDLDLMKLIGEYDVFIFTNWNLVSLYELLKFYNKAKSVYFLDGTFDKFILKKLK